MAHRRALVDHVRTGLLQDLDHRAGVASGRLKDADTGLERRARVALIVRRHDRREQRDVHTDRAILGALLGNLGVNERLGECDALLEFLGRRQRQRRDHTERTGVRNSGSKARCANPLHSTHNKRDTQAQCRSKLSLDRHRCNAKDSGTGTE